MTDKLKELVSELRYVAQWAEHHADKAQIITAGADAILALIKRAKDAEAEVERLKAQEPVGYVMHVLECSTLFLEKPDPNAIPLFLASGAAQKEQKHD